MCHNDDFHKSENENVIPNAIPNCRLLIAGGGCHRMVSAREFSLFKILSIKE